MSRAPPKLLIENPRAKIVLFTKVLVLNFKMITIKYFLNKTYMFSSST